jgi:hypothetical protein
MRLPIVPSGRDALEHPASTDRFAIDLGRKQVRECHRFLPSAAYHLDVI